MNKFITLMLFFSCGLVYAGGQKEIREQMTKESLLQCYSEALDFEAKFEADVQEQEADTSMQEKREELLSTCLLAEEAALDFESVFAAIVQEELKQEISTCLNAYIREDVPLSTECGLESEYEELPEEIVEEAFIEAFQELSQEERDKFSRLLGRELAKSFRRVIKYFFYGQEIEETSEEESIKEDNEAT